MYSSAIKLAHQLLLRELWCSTRPAQPLETKGTHHQCWCVGCCLASTYLESRTFVVSCFTQRALPFSPPLSLSHVQRSSALGSITCAADKALSHQTCDDRVNPRLPANPAPVRPAGRTEKHARALEAPTAKCPPSPPRRPPQHLRTHHHACVKILYNKQPEKTAFWQEEVGRPDPCSPQAWWPMQKQLTMAASWLQETGPGCQRQRIVWMHPRTYGKNVVMVGRHQAP
jgi:hypothetical protein